MALQLNKKGLPRAVSYGGKVENPLKIVNPTFSILQWSCLERGMGPQGPLAWGLLFLRQKLSNKFWRMNTSSPPTFDFSSVPVPVLLETFREKLEPLVKEYEEASRLSWFSRTFFSDHAVIEYKIVRAYLNLMQALEGRGQEVASTFPKELKLLPQEMGKSLIMIEILKRVGIPASIQTKLLESALKN